MRQALHILKKDALCLRKELALVVVLAFTFAWATTHTPIADWSEVLLCIGAVHLIGRLIHAETIPGDRQFWTTRPYRWKSLLGAKVLGLLIFVNVPIFLARVYILYKLHFPLQALAVHLAWSQFLIFIVATLPVAALAAVTAGVVPFTFITLVLVTAGYVIDGSLVRSPRLLHVTCEWVWNSVASLTLIAFAIPVLYLQYQKHSTILSRSLIATIAIVGGLVYIYLPWPADASIEDSISPRAFDSNRLQLQLDPAHNKFFPLGMMRRGGKQMDVPIAVKGIPSDVELIPDSVTLTFQSADHTEWNSGYYLVPSLAKQEPGAGDAMLNANIDVPLDVYERLTKGGAQVRGSLYLSVFGDAENRIIPMQKGRVELSGGLQCSMGAFSQLICGSAFRWPDELIYVKFRDGSMLPFTRSVSHSPFPSGPELFTSESRRVSVSSTEEQVTIVRRRRLMSFRKDFRFDDYPAARLSFKPEVPNRATTRQER